MKAIAFRPLRRVKKTGKIVVASYPLWNRVRTADYGAFDLTIDREYAGLPVDEQVYNHEGKPLFWRDFDPESIPIWESTPETSFEDWQAFSAQNRGFYAVRHQPFQGFPNGSISYTCGAWGLDCQGTPTFSHLTIDDVAEHRAAWVDYEPLTVGTVLKWYAWWLCQLENASLHTK